MVLTDDYSLYESVRMKYPDITFYTLCQPSENGYIHNSFSKRTGKDKHAQMCRFITTFDALMKADAFCGSVAPAPGLVLLGWHYKYGKAIPIECNAEDMPKVLEMPVAVRANLRNN